READCPACFLARETESALISWMAKANLRDHETLRRLADSGGLCAAHWLALARRPDRGSVRALRRALAHVGRAALEGSVGGSPKAAPRCPICASMRRRARGTVEMLLTRLDEPSGPAEVARSFGLCQPHVAVALDAGGRSDRVSTLLAIQRTQLRRLLEALDSAREDEAAAEAAARLVRVKLAGSLTAGG